METEHIEIWPKGVKKTKQREKLLRILDGADRPLTAGEIYEIFKEDEEKVWISTVYRTLEIFVEKGLADKIGMLGSDTAFYERKRQRHNHYAVCLRCQKIIPLPGCPMEHMTPFLEEQGFQVTGHHIEIFGLCKECGKG